MITYVLSHSHTLIQITHTHIQRRIDDTYKLNTTKQVQQNLRRLFRHDDICNKHYHPHLNDGNYSGYLGLGLRWRTENWPLNCLKLEGVYGGDSWILSLY